MAARDVNLSIGSLTAGVGTLVAAVSGLTGVGTLDRLERNEPKILFGALLLVLLASLLFVAAGLPVTGGRSELLAKLIATGLTIVGVSWAIAAQIRTAGERERPAMTIAVDEGGTTVEGSVEAAHFSSDARVTVLVDGLTSTKDGGWEVHNLAQYHVGPDDAGKIAQKVDVRVPPIGYESIGMKAWSDDSAEPCAATYPAGTNTRARTGCIVVPLPLSPTGAPAPASPQLWLNWAGTGTAPRRLRVRVEAEHATSRIAVAVAGRREGRTVQLYRAVTSPDVHGHYRTVLRLPVAHRYRRICAVAAFDGGGAAVAPLACPLPGRLADGRVGAQIDGRHRRPPADP